MNVNFHLRMACGKADTENGASTILIKIPSEGRYVAGGISWFLNPHKDDKISVYVSDEDNILGLGAGAIVGSYTDSDVAEENRGWYLTTSTKQIEAKPVQVNDLGFVMANLYLKIVGTKGDVSTDTLYVNLHWAKEA